MSAGEGARAGIERAAEAGAWIFAGGLLAVHDGQRQLRLGDGDSVLEALEVGGTCTNANGMLGLVRVLLRNFGMSVILYWEIEGGW